MILRGDAQIKRKRYLAFIYIGGVFFFLLLVVTIILKQLYIAPTQSLISEHVDAILFEVLVLISGAGFASSVIGTIIDQYQRRVGDSQVQLNRFIGNEGIVEVFKSASDPRLIQYIQSLISTATSEIFFSGLGLGLLAHNMDLLVAIGRRLEEKKNLEVNIFIGSHKNAGVQNRINEERDWHNKNGINYDPSWVTRYPAEIRSVLNHHLNDKTRSRLKIVDLEDCPMSTVIKIDDHFLLFIYGTPNVRGSQSPWLAIDRSNGNGEIVRFLSAIVNYYKGL